MSQVNQVQFMLSPIGVAGIGKKGIPSQKKNSNPSYTCISIVQDLKVGST